MGANGGERGKGGRKGDRRLGEKNQCGGGRGGELGLKGQGRGCGRREGLEEGGELMGLAVRGIRRGAGRMLGMEIQEAAGEERGNGRWVGTHGSGVWEGRGVRSGRRVRGPRPGSARSGCALCPGAPLTLRRRRPPGPPTLSPPHLFSTSTDVCEGGAKSRTGFLSQILGWISWDLDSPPPTT